MEREKQTKIKKRQNPLTYSLRTVASLATALQTKGEQTAKGVALGWRRLLTARGIEAGEKRGLLLFLSLVGVFGVVSVAAAAQFPLGTFPVGFSLAAAVGGGVNPFPKRGEGKELKSLESVFLVTVFAAVLFASLWMGTDGFYYLVTHLIFMLLRFLFTGGRFCDSVLARVTLSAAVSVGTGLFLSLMKGFTLNSVFAAVAMGLLTPVFTYLLCGFFVYAMAEEGSLPSQRLRVYPVAAAFAVVYLFLFSLREWEVLNFSPAFLLAVIVTLFAAGRHGPLWGGAWGMVTGMALSSFVMAPALAVGGFFAGLFFRFSPAAALMISFVTTGGYCLFTMGFSAFGKVAADFLLAVTLYLPLLRLPSANRKKREPVFSPGQKEAVRRAEERLRNLGESFSSLSQVFYTVSETMKKPGVSELSRLVSAACSQVCTDCPRSGLCWGRERDTLTAMEMRAASALMNRGKVVREDLGEEILRRCPGGRGLLEEINRRYRKRCGEGGEMGKTGLLAGEYSAVARLMKNTAGELSQELEMNPKWEKKAEGVLSSLGIRYGRVCVFGSRRLRIDVYGVSPEGVRQGADRLVLAFEEAFGMLFDGPRFIMLEESVVLRLVRRRCLGLECAKSGCAKKGESISGDSVSFFETKGDLFYALICDGMGSGREAAFTSRLSALFIEKLMHCATPKNVTLEMLNAFLMSKSDETFTTVDLLEVDLFTGESKFIKAGAAPSFVLRGDRIHHIRSLTPPAGILSRMSAEETRFRLKPGDFVLQLSDGAENKNGDHWLFGVLGDHSFQTAGELCDFVFRAAREKGGEQDDLSISVIRVVNNK